MYDIRLLKALADDTRLQIVLSLLEQERSVLDIVSVVKKSQPNVSIALRKLEDAGLIKSRKDGRQAFYSLVDTQFVTRLLEMVKRA